MTIKADDNDDDIDGENGDDDVDSSDVDYAGRRHVHDLTRL